MGVVYQGLHVRLEQLVAIKDLSPEFASDPEMRRRFIREAKIQARLNHPNVVNVHNLLEYKGRFLLVMEFVEGITLDKLIQNRGGLPYNEAIHIARQVLDALSFMHSRGVIHRDLKPGNIIITKEGLIKVTDFGIAKALTDRGHTRSGVRLGTLWYMSPEQVKGKSVDARSDLYAMGITLFQMVTGKLPFFGKSDFEIMKAQTEKHPPDPEKIKKDIPKFLSWIILKLLEKDPDRRFQSAAEVIKALEFQSGIPEVPHKISGPSTDSEAIREKRNLPRHRKRRSPVFAWIIFIILLCGIGTVIFTYWYLNRGQAIITFVESPALEKKAVATHGPEIDEGAIGKEAGSGEDVTPNTKEIREKEEKGEKGLGTAVEKRPFTEEKTEKSMGIAAPSTAPKVSKIEEAKGKALNQKVKQKLEAKSSKLNMQGKEEPPLNVKRKPKPIHALHKARKREEVMTIDNLLKSLRKSSDHIKRSGKRKSLRGKVEGEEGTPAFEWAFPHN